MRAFRLPVSGLPIVLRPPKGAEDMLLADAFTCDIALALALVSALARTTEGKPLAWEALSTTDLDAALLCLRQMLVGDLIRTDVACPGEECGERIDIAFRVSDYLAHIRPRLPRGVERTSDAEWFRMPDLDVAFRVPSGADQLAAADQSNAMQVLMQRCIRPFDVPARVRRRVEAAMELLAPSLYTDLEGVCPACSTTVCVAFDPQRYILQELRNHAASIYEEVHLLARCYHWSEQQILDLPRAQRTRYAEFIHAEKGAFK